MKVPVDDLGAKRIYGDIRIKKMDRVEKNVIDAVDYDIFDYLSELEANRQRKLFSRVGGVVQTVTNYRWVYMYSVNKSAVLRGLNG